MASCFLNVFQEQCDEDSLTDEGVLELHVAVFAGEEVVEVEVELAELFQDFPAEDIAQPDK